MTRKIGRNAPCPCGSGKKYKRCCGKAPQHKARPPNPPAQATQAPNTLVPVGDWMPMDDAFDLDELSNSIVDLLDQGRLGEAEAAWKTLNEKYPDMIDPLDRKAMILEAKGEHANAAEYYRRAAEYARTHDGFDDDGVNYFLRKASQLADAASAAEQS